MSRAPLIALAALLAAPAAAATPAALPPGEDRPDLSAALEILEDPEAQWTADDVASPPLAGRFRPFDRSDREVGPSASAFWLRFTVTSSAEAAAEDWLVVSYGMANDSVQLFWRDGGRWQTSRGGYRYSGVNQTPLALRAELPAAGERTFLVRVASRDYLYLDVRLLTRRAYEQSERWTHLFHGGFFGLMDLMLLLSLLLLVVFKDRSYLYYVCYLAALSVYLFAQNGYAHALFPLPMLYAWVEFHTVMIGLIVLSIVAFTRSFLKTRQSTPRTDRFLLAYAAASVLTIALVFFADYTVQMSATIVLGMLAPLGTLLPGVLRLRQGFRPARLYVAAWGVVGLGAFLFAAQFDLPVSGPGIFQAACLANAMLVTLAMVDQLRRYRQERETALQAQRVSEDLYRTIFDTTGTSMITFDETTTITLANEEWAKLVGVPLDAMLGKKSWTEFFTEASLEKMRAYHAQRGQDPSSVPRAYEAQVRGADGQIHDGIITVALVPGTQMRVSSFQDLTDLKRAQQQMYRADKMAALGQIIAGVAHEINNPNNFIVFNIPILKRYVEAITPLLDAAVAGLDDPRILNMPYKDFVADVFKLLENMAHGSSRITEIVADLKSYVGDHDEDTKQAAPLGPVIDRVMTLVGKQVRKTVKRFDVEAEDDLPAVLMNAGRIEQVLINLIINAGQAADKDDAWVTLGARRCAADAAWIEITVEDNGTGIPTENIDKIFDPFFTSKGRGEGTGLGLAISQQIVEDHGGALTVTSTPGQGTRFTLRLPVHVGGNA